MKQLDVYQRVFEIFNLSQKGAFTFDMIKKRIRTVYQLKGMYPMYSMRTFQRDLVEIREMHGIDIQYNRGIKAYEVNQDYSSKMLGEILESIEMIHTFKMQQGLENIVFLDEQKSSGYEQLNELIYAIKNRVKIKFNYLKGWDINKEKQIKPLALKEFKNTWYLIGLNEDDEMRNYGLDRISDLQVLSAKFDVQSEINLADYYQNTYGILNDANEPVEEITLSFTPEKGNYIKSKPIHSSQTILIADDNEFKIQLRIKINPDFIAEVLSFGNTVTIINPVRLKHIITLILKDMLQRLE